MSPIYIKTKLKVFLSSYASNVFASFLLNLYFLVIDNYFFTKINFNTFQNWFVFPGFCSIMLKHFYGQKLIMKLAVGTRVNLHKPKMLIIQIHRQKKSSSYNSIHQINGKMLIIQFSYNFKKSLKKDSNHFRRLFEQTVWSWKKNSAIRMLPLFFFCSFIFYRSDKTLTSKRFVAGIQEQRDRKLSAYHCTFWPRNA